MIRQGQLGNKFNLEHSQDVPIECEIQCYIIGFFEHQCVYEWGYIMKSLLLLIVCSVSNKPTGYN